MAAMLGVVLSDNLLTLFVFWELTSFSSYLLIGFDHERARRPGGGPAGAARHRRRRPGAAGRRRAARRGGGHDQLSALARQTRPRSWRSPFYAAIAGLVLLAAFTKSAQVPFHFWLPNAMEAPTPVSAYLHSATMVKAGVYLLARLTPVLGGTTLWTTAVTVAGAATMLVGACRAVQETDLKRILAYSTVSALGMLTLLLGLGTPRGDQRRARLPGGPRLYKGALFLVAGAIDHETGTRDSPRSAGLRRAMPLTALAGGAAALSMAGVPPLLGFIAKDASYEALLHAAAGPVAAGAVVVVEHPARRWPGCSPACCRSVGRHAGRSTRTTRRGRCGCRRCSWPPVGVVAGLARRLDGPLAAAATRSPDSLSRSH